VATSLILVRLIHHRPAQSGPSKPCQDQPVPSPSSRQKGSSTDRPLEQLRHDEVKKINYLGRNSPSALLLRGHPGRAVRGSSLAPKQLPPRQSTGSGTGPLATAATPRRKREATTHLSPPTQPARPPLPLSLPLLPFPVVSSPPSPPTFFPPQKHSPLHHLIHHQPTSQPSTTPASSLLPSVPTSSTHPPILDPRRQLHRVSTVPPLLYPHHQ
jgi:hypothetical protein